MGRSSFAVGFSTQATGDVSTSLGNFTIAVGNASVAMGAGITAHEDESLAVSGDVYARNFLFHADERLMHDVSTPTAQSSDVPKDGMLGDVGALRVVEYAESDGTTVSSLPPRTLGLIAKEEDARVRSGVTVGGTIGRVKSLDLRVVVAQLVGAVQELTAQNKAQAAEMKAQAATIAAQAAQLADMA